MKKLMPILDLLLSLLLTIYSVISLLDKDKVPEWLKWSTKIVIIFIIVFAMVTLCKMYIYMCEIVNVGVYGYGLVSVVSQIEKGVKGYNHKQIIEDIQPVVGYFEISLENGNYKIKENKGKAFRSNNYGFLGNWKAASVHISKEWFYMGYELEQNDADEVAYGLNYKSYMYLSGDAKGWIGEFQDSIINDCRYGKIYIEKISSFTILFYRIKKWFKRVNNTKDELVLSIIKDRTKHYLDKPNSMTKQIFKNLKVANPSQIIS